MKILTIVGARPNFMKVAPIIAAINGHNRRVNDATPETSAGASRIEHVLVHTGQHYDEIMSGSFFSDLNLPKPDVHMGVGSGSHALQTAEIMKKFEEIAMNEKPDAVIVVGDVNSTLACALVASKISFDASGKRPMIAHVEAGLRSFDRTMPEEVNRIVTDHVSDLLFVTEESGLANLTREGIPSEKVHFVGNTMIDSLLTFKSKAEASSKLDELGLRSKSAQNGDAPKVARYALLTLHRPANVDNRESFENILAGLQELGGDCPIIFPVHPRTRKRIEEFGFNLGGCDGTKHSGSSRGIILIDPVGYLDFLCLMKNAWMVLTDSGGIQEETTCLGIPCVTIRENTERPVTVEKGTNILAGTSRDGIRAAIRAQSQREVQAEIPMHWDGKAAIRIVDVLVQAWAKQRPSVRPVLV
ncbi:MAG TPA: UDP-N-acetylglucosamine 2-epimerase (non-hydrolyzing) [Candidatus Acidoferrum sp.]|nr:UDP-N-acetylglucosamine 2-epimerase (non-hydrolyzing) [Candidatus Acidoferrum sp.]